MKKLFYVLLVLFIQVLFGCSTSLLKDKETSANEINETALSPDKAIELNFSVSDGIPMYSIKYNGENLLNSSKLGFILKENEKEIELNKNFAIISTEIKEVNNGTWSPVWGQQASYEDKYTSYIVKLKQTKNKKLKMNLEFRIYDNGIGFRYEIPQQKNLKEIVVTDEKTEFYMSDNYKSWWIPNDWDSYEYLYETSTLSKAGKKNGARYATREYDVSTPFTMKTKQKTHISIHEAALYNYPGMALIRANEDGVNTKFEAHLCPWTDDYKNNSDIKFKGIDAPAKELITPWRTIQIGENAGALAESGLILNLNEPNKIEDTSWIQPMKYIGIWWELHLGITDWGRHNNRHGATTENTKYHIDFAYEHLIKDTNNQKVGLLVEGWNKGWDGNWTANYNKFIFGEKGEYEDYDLSEVAEYGSDKGVHIFAHNETSGGITNYEEQLDEAYADYQRLNIPAIKSGYVADKGMRGSAPKGQHHHGQYMVNHYNNAVIKAAEYQIMINTHEPIKATGISRTYPNWIGREGVRGMEYNAWSDGNTPEHTTILPFTRVLGGPVDYTPGIFQMKLPRYNSVKTTRAKQLALYLTLYSPVPMVTDLPKNYLIDPNETDMAKAKTLPEFQFIKDLALDWDNSIVLDAEIGEYMAIARKTKNKDEWFIGAITNKDKRTLDLSFDFLSDKEYVAEIYRDGEGAHWIKNPTIVKIEKVIVNADTDYKAILAEGGGQAIRLYPASEKDKEKYRKY